MAEVKRHFWEEFESRMQLSGRRLLEESLKAEQRRVVRAEPYQRSSRRRCYRNGYYTRDVVWKLGVLSKVLVPRTRSGKYQSAILDRYRRFGGGFERQILQLFSLGLSTRRVERFFTEFFGQYELGSQTVSDILKRVAGELDEYRTRPLSDDVRYLYLDGLYLTIRSAFKRKYVVLVALAESSDGRRQIVGFQVASSEKTVSWQAFLDSLYRRGLKGKQLQTVVTDGAAGLIDAVRTVYGFVPIQVCWVHRQRNLVGKLKKRSHRKAICTETSRIFQADSKQDALQRLKDFHRRWHPKEPRAVNTFLKNIELSLTFFSQPKDHWRRLATNNIIERQLREIRRRIRLIDSFRDEQSCERIVYTQVKLLNQRLEKKPNHQFTQ
jgi:transposase-like protein